MVSRVSTISVISIMIWVAVISIPALRIGIRFSLSLGNRMYYWARLGVVSGIMESSVGVRMVTISMRIAIAIGVRVCIDEWLDFFDLLHLWLRDFDLRSLWQSVGIRIVISVRISMSQCITIITIVVRVWLVSGVVVIIPWIGFGFGFRLCYCESKKSENYNEFHGERLAAR